VAILHRRIAHATGTSLGPGPQPFGSMSRRKNEKRGCRKRRSRRKCPRLGRRKCPRLGRSHCNCCYCNECRILVATCDRPSFLFARSWRLALPGTSVFPLLFLRSASAAARAFLPTLCGRLAFDSSGIPSSALRDAHLWLWRCCVCVAESSSRSGCQATPSMLPCTLLEFYVLCKFLSCR
jgi:hypothetical protein